MHLQILYEILSISRNGFVHGIRIEFNYYFQNCSKYMSLLLIFDNDIQLSTWILSINTIEMNIHQSFSGQYLHLKCYWRGKPKPQQYYNNNQWWVWPLNKHNNIIIFSRSINNSSILEFPLYRLNYDQRQWRLFPHTLTSPLIFWCHKVAICWL